jgi:predicted PurR-regulated permease PerM
MDDETTDGKAASPVEADGRRRVDDVPAWVGRAIWRGIWQLILAVVVAAALLWFLGRASQLVGFLLVSQLFAFVLEPGVTMVHEKWGWRRGTATGALLAAVGLVFAVLIVTMVPVLLEQLDALIAAVPGWIDQLNAFIQRQFGITIASPSQAQGSDDAIQGVVTYLESHAGDLIGAVGSLVGVIFSMFTVALFTFYLTANGPQVRRAVLSRLPPERQRRVLWAWDTAIEKSGGYVYSRVLLSLINGGLMLVTLLLVGVPYPLPLALFVGVVAAFIPIVGTYVAGAAPVIVALASVGPLAAVIVLAEILLYQALENYVLSPRLSQRTMELNAGLSFGAAMAGGAVGGFIGAFFALPTAAVIQAFLSTYSRRYEVVESELTHVDGQRVSEPPAPETELPQPSP